MEKKQRCLAFKQSSWQTKQKKTFYEGIRKVYGSEQNKTYHALSGDGNTLLKDKNEILVCSKEHFEGVLKLLLDVDNDSVESVAEKTKIPELNVDLVFVELHSMKQMLSVKPPSEETIAVEIYKSECIILVYKLQCLFILIWKRGNNPQEIQNTSIAQLLKK